MTAVMLFAKAPREGFVKTRLAASIGARRAVDIYRELGARVKRQVESAHQVTVWFDPPEALAEMQSWLGAGNYRPQAAGDLGHRLRAAFAAHFDDGDRPVVAIGTDAPAVDADAVADAVRRLEASDVVLGPALDGGYYLLGLSRPAPDLLQSIPWGTGEVLRATLERCARLGLTADLLAPLRDLDTAEDLRALGLASP
jgi:rSAM/selenodomain-associated transferase 1